MECNQGTQRKYKGVVKTQPWEPPTNTNLPLVTCGMLRLKTCCLFRTDLVSASIASLCGILLSLLVIQDVDAQSRSVRDSALFSPHFQLHGGFGTSAGDLGNRFGNGAQVGMGFHIKFPSGFYTGIQADFGFGMKLMEQGVLSNLLNPAGQLIDNEGQVALLALSGRSGLVTLDAGRLFRLRRTNANSGILINFGLGSVHHRVHFENTENPITQLDEPYLSGYDRFTWGVAFKQFVGYWHMSDNGLVNWFAGVQVWEAKTWPQRPLNFDTQTEDKSPRLDLYGGIQVGWIFHFYKRTAVEHWN